MLSARQVVELFHLRFVHAFFGGLPDKTLAAIKGGINLRFFFQSVRFSEDLDLDIMKMAKGTLENRVDRLMSSPALLGALKAKQLDVRDVGKPKQTDTVQKWKLAIASLETGSEVRTKIEFSRRDDVRTAVMESIDQDIATKYGMARYFANHYQVRDAVSQKVHALMDRAETQPRDVFDLNVLFARPDAPSTLDEEGSGWIDSAIENAMGISYEQYEALVVAYLEPDHIELYGSRESWELMQSDVINRLETLR